MLPPALLNIILDFAASMEEYERRLLVHEELQQRNVETVFRVWFFFSRYHPFLGILFADLCCGASSLLVFLAVVLLPSQHSQPVLV